MAVAVMAGAQRDLSPADAGSRTGAHCPGPRSCSSPVALPHLPPDRRRNSAAANARLRRCRRRRGGPGNPIRRGLHAASCLRRRSGDPGGCRGPLRRLNPRWRVAAPAGSSDRGAAASSFGAEVSAVTAAVRAATAGRFATVTRRWPASAGRFGAEVWSATSEVRRLRPRPLRVGAGRSGARGRAAGVGGCAQRLGLQQPPARPFHFLA